MENMTEAMQTLGAMMAPAAMITACSLLLLGVYDKYSKIVACIRTLNDERRHLFKGGDCDTLLPEQENRERQIMGETQLLRGRLGNVLRQVQAIMLATAAFLTASLTIGAGLILHLNLAMIVGILMGGGLVLLLIAMLQSLLEIPMIGHIINTELQTLPTSGSRQATRISALKAKG